ncbi:hypothetical protein [Luteimonas terrae]|uniref:DUF2268 domain-containing protein n=1 Tax=Luteimonas terrae TaxID=1530191 RepID=A0ABU1XRZ7_9GAMM|nr:hypothetical protein [Luteimonas terrae]MDR7191532.1 hypothetical protein [Luteimonas terrae]
MSGFPLRALPRVLIVLLLWVGVSAAAFAADCACRYTDKAALQSGAQSMVDGFVDAVRASGRPGFTGVPVVVETTPSLILVDFDRRTIFVPWWDDMDPATQAVFAQLAGDEAAGRQLFDLLFQQFFVVHEAAHWLQFQASGLRDNDAFFDQVDHYRNESEANAFAVAYWMRTPEGVAFLDAMAPVVAKAHAMLPDPVPTGTTAPAYFNDNYEALGRDPMQYGWYQFQFVLDALAQRETLSLPALVAGLERGDPQPPRIGALWIDPNAAPGLLVDLPR